MNERARVRSPTNLVALSSSEPQRSSPSLLGAPLRDEIKRIVIEALKEVDADSTPAIELLTPEQLAERLQIPVTWVYEQSRQGNIPTHRLGRYIRFDLSEVLKSQKKKD